MRCGDRGLRGQWRAECDVIAARWARIGWVIDFDRASAGLGSHLNRPRGPQRGRRGGVLPLEARQAPPRPAPPPGSLAAIAAADRGGVWGGPGQPLNGNILHSFHREYAEAGGAEGRRNGPQCRAPPRPASSPRPHAADGTVNVVGARDRTVTAFQPPAPPRAPPRPFITNDSMAIGHGIGRPSRAGSLTR